MLKIEIERKSKRALRKDIFKSNRNFELGQVAHWITSEQLENVVFTELCLIAAMWVIFSCHELVDHLYQDTIQDFFLRVGHDTTYAFGGNHHFFNIQRVLALCEFHNCEFHSCDFSKKSNNLLNANLCLMLWAILFH